MGRLGCAVLAQARSPPKRPAKPLAQARWAAAPLGAQTIFDRRPNKSPTGQSANQGPTQYRRTAGQVWESIHVYVYVCVCACMYMAAVAACCMLIARPAPLACSSLLCVRAHSLRLPSATQPAFASICRVRMRSGSGGHGVGWISVGDWCADGGAAVVGPQPRE